LARWHKWRYWFLVKFAIQVATPPSKPVMVYDGECNFCRLWICRWQQSTGERVDYIPYQEPTLRSRFPELPINDLQQAVHLVLTDGSVCRAAEAAFRALAENPHERWLLDWYHLSPPFAFLTERAYRLVARHRAFFSVLTRLAWGHDVERPTYSLGVSIFLRGLGVIYLIAFVSLAIQIVGLLGANGILPVKETMQVAAQEMSSAKVGLDRYHLMPTLCWFGSNDRFLQIHCAAGAVLSVLVILGIAPAPCLFLLWVLYLSLMTVGRDFLGFQWDNLLLETGFLAIFSAPLQFRYPFQATVEPSRVALWLLRWLLFRLMFESGCVKLLSGDLAWRNLTALSFHYETQPLPTWIGWYAHQLPSWIQKLSTVVMFGMELVLPFLIFTPRRFRCLACLGFTLLQIFILLTGNYCFFNLLTLLLCLLLIDNKTLQALVPAKYRSKDPSSHAPIHDRHRWPLQALFPLTCIVLAVSLVQLTGMFRLHFPWPRPVLSLYSWLAPLRTFNGYGLFAVMTTHRPEIIIEGSTDGARWEAYEFKYKPGDLKQRPRFVEPHQPRLDWQMWFAALGSYRENPWLINFCVRLLQGSRETQSLLAGNPFPKAPPRYIRALLYEYHFTDWSTRRKTGAWWQRELKGQYLPVLALRDGQ
jgi:predicted DCC family thiol-disulfide oxidoreductase YuxK